MVAFVQRHLFGLAIVLSIALHAAAVLWGGEKTEPPKLLPVKSGRASISLRSAAAASPRAGASSISATQNLLAALPALPMVKGIENAPETNKPQPKAPVPVERPRTNAAEQQLLQAQKTMAALPDLPALPRITAGENSDSRSSTSARLTKTAIQTKPAPADNPRRTASQLPPLEAKTTAAAPPDIGELPPLPGIPTAENSSATASPQRDRPVSAPNSVKATVKPATGSDSTLPALAAATVVADYVSMPSRGSRGSQGAEVDGMPSEGAFNPAPPYPPDALAAGLEGTVVLLVKIDATGKVTSITVYQSSNVASLDKSALETVRQWQFSPARRGGVAVPFEFRKPIEFTITRRR